MRSALIAAVLTVAAGTACAQEKLMLYNWFEYTPSELIEKFTAETGIEVVVDTYDSNEALLAAIKAGGLGTYDLALPNDYMVGIMAQEGLLDTIQPGELKNVGNIEERWVDVPFDPGRKHSVPYQWGSTSFAVSRDVYTGDIGSLSILFDPPAELAGRINMVDSQPEVMALASLYLGIPQCTTDRTQLKALNDLLQRNKPNWASFNADTAKEVLVSGDVAAGMIWNGFAAKARAEGANIEYAYPKEGYVVWSDSLVLLKDAPNHANALRFMDFMLEPDNVAILTNWTSYSASVKGVAPLLDPALAAQPELNPPPGTPTGSFLQVCDEATQAVYDRIWSDLRK